jgi:hypothetical protein
MNEQEIKERFPQYGSAEPGDPFYRHGYVSYPFGDEKPKRFAPDDALWEKVYEEEGLVCVGSWVARFKISNPEHEKIQLVALATGNKLTPCNGGFEIPVESTGARAFEDANMIAEELAQAFGNCNMDLEISIHFNYTEFTMRVFVGV